MQIYIQRLTLSLFWVTCIAIILACLMMMAATLGWLPPVISQANAGGAELKDHVKQYQESECLELYEDSDVYSMDVQKPLVKI